MIKSNWKKSFYVSLFALLGIILFFIVEKSILLFLFWIKIDVNAEPVILFDFFLGVLALFLGLWFGVYSGIKWYAHIYENFDLATEKDLDEKTQTVERDVITTSDWKIEDLVTKNPGKTKFVKEKTSSPGKKPVRKITAKRSL